MTKTPTQQFIHFLSDMYSVEQQALAQLVSAPEIAGDYVLGEIFRKHYVETELQAALMQGRLEANGGSCSAVKQAIMKLGGKGFLLFARLQPETPGRLVAHAYSYESMEWAGYEMLIRFAEQAGDLQTAETARTIRDQERAMMERLESAFDIAEQASHRNQPQDMIADLCKHIGEAHALEMQGVHLLEKSKEIAGDPELGYLCSRHRERSLQHAKLLEERLHQFGESPSAFKDAILGFGGLNWGFFFQSQPDTPAKLVAFAYAYEHLKIAGYELLKRTARRAGEPETMELCERLIDEERIMTDELVDSFDSAAISTLAEVAV
jgi:ferritin-like metal-binding protein YciE